MEVAGGCDGLYLMGGWMVGKQVVLLPPPSTAQSHHCSPRSWSLAGLCLGERQRSPLSPVDPQWTLLCSCPLWGVADH